MRPGATQGLTARHVHVTCFLVSTACRALALSEQLRGTSQFLPSRSSGPGKRDSWGVKLPGHTSTVGASGVESEGSGCGSNMPSPQEESVPIS